MVSTTLFIVVVGFAFLVIDTESIFLPKRANGYEGRDSIIDPKKRPFCNAFTGCGRKRSNLPALSMQGDNDETIDSLLELSAEPAVEDLSRQIMSEAKLWEAIQEANMEILRRKQESAEGYEEEPATPARSATASCALPPCYI
ncbi:PREDICTED: cardioactive peptide [Nicrophorus vespilloides]|uniref:Cardioactive peptide n=1 Tax=Nicrophorus vespilloides TaxID=110193 RepID=A0ABM1MW40_NICVS|nr:PREDICTED: cardioactive peptide [Nicrophorus vespilloides]XP_017778792.1 PREDICTED: cardioactive peptide [Nicrophorus vespilloides]